MFEKSLKRVGAARCGWVLVVLVTVFVVAVESDRGGDGWGRGCGAGGGGGGGNGSAVSTSQEIEAFVDSTMTHPFSGGREVEAGEKVALMLVYVCLLMITETAW